MAGVADGAVDTGDRAMSAGAQGLAVMTAVTCFLTGRPQQVRQRRVVWVMAPAAFALANGLVMIVGPGLDNDRIVTALAGGAGI